MIKIKTKIKVCRKCRNNWSNSIGLMCKFIRSLVIVVKHCIRYHEHITVLSIIKHRNKSKCADCNGYH